MDDNMTTDAYEDDLSTLSTDDPAGNTYPNVFPPSTHTLIGSYLIIVGKSNSCFVYPV